MRFRLLVAAICLMLCSPSFPEQIEVPTDYTSIQAAINAAHPGDEIIVSPGIYTESIDYLGKDIRVRSSHGYASTVIDGTGRDSVVKFRNGEGSKALLEGFTLLGGTGTNLPLGRLGGGILCETASPTIRANFIKANSAASGGGIACVLSSAPTLESNRFEGNRAQQGSGAGAYADTGSALTLVGNTFTRNEAFAAGGAVFVGADSALTAEMNTFEQNRAREGGALYCTESTGALFDNAFIENAAQDGFAGGAAFFDCLSSVFELRGNRFERNTAARGGAILSTDSTLRMIQNHFVANEAVEGGACLLRETPGRTTIDGDRYLRNIAFESGGALMFSAGQQYEVRSCVFVGNEATLNGDSNGGAALLAIATASILIENCTITQNRSGDTGSVHTLATPVRVENSILWMNSPREITSTHFRPVIRNSIVTGGWPYPGEGNMDVDPAFVSLTDADVHIRWGSPAIDAGDNSVVQGLRDADDAPRITDGDLNSTVTVDIGAFEAQPGITARYGATNWMASTGLARPLSVNGSSGEDKRIVRVASTEPVVVTLVPSPAGPSPASFVLYGWLDVPDVATVQLQPFDLGLMGFPTPLVRSEPRSNLPVVIWNNMGFERRLGKATRSSSPAPTIVFESTPVGTELDFTLQGFIQDAGSAVVEGVSITNAVVVEIR